MYKKSKLSMSILVLGVLIYLSATINLLNSSAYVIIDDPGGGTDIVGWELEGGYYHTIEKYADYSPSASYDNLVWYSMVFGDGIDSTSGTWDELLRLHIIVQAAVNPDLDYSASGFGWNKYWYYLIDEITVKLKIVYVEDGANQLLSPNNIITYGNQMLQTEALGNVPDNYMKFAIDGMVWLFNKIKDGLGTAVKTVLDSTANGNWPAGWSHGVSGDYYRWNLNHGWGAGQQACGVHIIIEPWWFAYIGQYRIYVDVDVTGKIVGGQSTLGYYTRINQENVFTTHRSYDFFVTCTDF